MGGFGLMTAVWALLALFLVGLAFRSWRLRAGAQSAKMPKPASVPAQVQGIRFERLHYVGTVFTDSPLQRVVSYGLGMRGRCDLVLAREGIALFRKGETEFLIPRNDLVAVASESSALGKAVEADGLRLVEWQLGDKVVTTALRFTSRADQRDFDIAVANFFSKEESK